MSDTHALTNEITLTAITRVTTLRVVSMRSPPRERRDPLVRVAAFGKIARLARLVPVPLQIDHRNQAAQPVIKRSRPIPIEVLAIGRPRPKRLFLRLLEPRQAGAIEQPHAQDIVPAGAGIVGLAGK